MATYQELEQAISVLEQEQSRLDPNVLTVSLAALREKLALMQAQAAVEQHLFVTALVADLSGFTAMSELRDAEEVRDTINEVWQKLDSVIESWGGRVDKHIGDAVIALFGVPNPREDDAERAVQAALDMQMELTIFNERTRRQRGQSQHAWSTPQAQLRMRIGLHSGPVFFGRVGNSQDTMAVGDAINIANQLEKMAPVEGILISEEVYHRVQRLFEVEQMEPVLLNGRLQPSQLFVVLREKTRPFHMSIRGIAGVEARIVGRNDELARLQDMLQMTLDGGSCQVVTIIGESGVGKSRLLYEFERLLRLLPERIALFKGRVHQEVGQSPYALFRDLLANYFDIHRRNSPAVAREKLVRGMTAALDEEATRARERAHYVGHLLGFDFSDSPYFQGKDDDVRQVREYAFQDLAALITSVASNNSAAVLFLEDVHWADEGSFDLIDYLVQTCLNTPLMVVCVARPTLFEKRPSWQIVETINDKTYRRIQLPALTPIDARHLVMEILRHVAQLPMRLVESIVAGAQGNPFYIEELIELLIAAEVIVPGESRWQINLANMPDLTPAPSLEGLIRMRLEKLSALEQHILQRAAVLGHVFWEPLLNSLMQAVDSSLTLERVQEGVYRLEKKGWIYRRKLSSMAEIQEYAFRHDSLRQAIYEMIPLPQRRRDHHLAAKWFEAHTGKSAMRHASVIAHHFEQTHAYAQAAIWHNRAATYARNAYLPETAISFYQHALQLLPTTPETAVARIKLNEGLGDMLRSRARFQAAIAAFLEMRTAARRAENETAELQALYHLLGVFCLQGNHTALLKTANITEKAARQARSREYLAISLAAAGWAYLAMDRMREAIPPAKEALAISTTAGAPRAIAFSQAVLGNIGRVTGHGEQATQLLQRAQALLHDENERMWEGLMLANLGHVAQQQDDLHQARSYYEESLRIARDTGDYFAAILSLHKLGNIVRRLDRFEEAELYFQQALIFAEKSGSLRYRALIAGDLGHFYLLWSLSPGTVENIVEAEGYIHRAYNWLDKAITLGEASANFVTVANAYVDLALLQRHDERLVEAVDTLQLAIAAARRAADVSDEGSAVKSEAMAWYMLGQILLDLAAGDTAVTYSGKTISVRDCFQRSEQLFGQIGRKGSLLRIDVLETWAEFEASRGQTARSRELQERINALKSALLRRQDDAAPE